MPYAPDAPASKAKVAGVVMFYMVSALVMIFVNKAVLNSSPELPFTFLFIQMGIAVLLLHVLSAIVPKSSPLKPKVAIPELNAETAYKLMPVISIGVIALVFNTLCLRNVDASFFQIARGLLLPFTILVAAIQSRLIPRSNVLRAAFLVTMGFFVGISPSSFFRSSDMQINADGEILPGSGGQAAGLDADKVLALVYGSLSAIMTAVHAVMVKNAVRTMDGSILKLTYWNNFMSAFFLFPCMIMNGEAALFIRKFIIPFSSSLTSLPSAAPTPLLAALIAERNTFITGSLVTGFFGFLLGLAGLLSIKVTSPVTHMVTSATRSVVQTFLGVLLFGEIVTSRRAGSIGVITLGAVYYTWIQSSSPPPPVTTMTDGDREAMRQLAQEDDSPSVKAAWARGHGTTNSLATLLPLHAPKAIRSNSVDGHRRLGSISEEEELSYGNDHRAYHDASSDSSRSSSWNEKESGGINEKGLVPEDDLLALGSRSRSPDSV